MATKLEAADIERRMRDVQNWRLCGEAIERTYDREDFDGSIAFVNDVARAANRADHHPDISVAWNKVTLRLSSHDAGGLTERDFALAAVLDAIAAEGEGRAAS